MKTILFAFTIITLISCTNDSADSVKPMTDCDCKALQHDPSYNVFHLGDRLKPFTGKCLDYYRGGQLKKDFSLVDGKYDGSLLYYHPNGELQSIADYKQGLLFGDKKVYSDKGILQFHGIYKRNKLIETKFNINYAAQPSSD